MTPIYHITHINNLPAILREDGLLCDAEAERRGLCAQSIAYDMIKERRKRRCVQTLHGQPVAAGGVLADYVPFYFCNRSPMLGAIHKGGVPAYQGGQRDVLYLVAMRKSWPLPYRPGVSPTVTPSKPSPIFTRGSKILISWTGEAVRTWRWGGRWRLADPDITRRKQAEFLAHGRLPWVLVHSIGVLDAAMAAQVHAALADAVHKPRVTIEPKWYYNS